VFFLCQNGIIRIRAREISRKEGTHLPARYIINGVTVGGYDMRTKICGSCKEDKPFDEFHNSKSKHDGKVTKCKYCVRKYNFEKRHGKGCYVPEEPKITRLEKIIINDIEKVAKKCSKCKSVKTLDEFTSNKNGLGGRKSVCRSCECKRQKTPEFKNKRKLWYHENRDRERQRRRKYVKDNLDKVLATNKRWNEENRDLVKKINKKSYLKNRDRRLAYIKEYNKIPEVVEKRYAYKRTEKGRESTRRYNHSREANKKGLLNTLSANDWKNAKLHFANSCCYCGNDESEKLTQDHFFPLSKGGEYTSKNIIPACGSCNFSKNNKDFFDWYPKQPFYSKQRERKILKYLDIKDNEQQIALF
jgi:hypothetical protein